MLHLIIKGTLEEACNAAKQHGLPLPVAHEHKPLPGNPKLTEALARVDYSYWPVREALVRRWFAEGPHEAPYPAGTLLHFSVKE